MADDSRFLAVLDTFVARSRVNGERSINAAKMVLAALLIFRMMVVGPPLRSGSPRDWILLAVLTVSFGIGVVIESLMKRGAGRHTNIIGLSVSTDAAMTWVSLGALAIWPYPGYLGLVHSPSCAFVLLAVVAAALRFSVPLAASAIVANGICLVGLLSYERYGSPHRTANLEELLTVAILYVTTSTLAIALVMRGRQLMVSGSRAVLSAARATQHLGTYVSPEVAERALSGDELALGGQRQRVVCLFSDLRGFTTYSESLPPEQLVAELNDYLEAMVKAATSEGGVVDKFIGDAIMVVFGTRDPLPDDGARAIRTARSMQRALAAHNRQRMSRGLPALAQGIGIHAGPAIVGNVGASTRMQHTVVGSVINIASRLEAATKELGVAVVISADTVDFARDAMVDVPPLRSMPPIRVRGVREPLAIYSFPDDGFSLTGLQPQN